MYGRSLALSSHGSEMLSSGLHNISRLHRDDGTIGMSHKCRDNIGVRKGGVEKLGVGLSLSRPLAVNIGVSSVVKIALGGKMSGGGSKVVVVSRDNSAVSIGNQLGVGIGGVKGGDGAISVVHKGVSLGGPLAVHSVGVS